MPALLTGDDFTISSPFLVNNTLVKSSSVTPEATPKRATSLFQAIFNTKSRHDGTANGSVLLLTLTRKP